MKSDFANKKKVKVIRAGTGEGVAKQEFEVNLADILERGKTEQDLVLQAGDMVVVPKRGFLATVMLGFSGSTP